MIDKGCLFSKCSCPKLPEPEYYIKYMTPKPGQDTSLNILDLCYPHSISKVILIVVTIVNLDLAMQCFLNQAVRRINVIVVFLQNVLYIYNLKCSILLKVCMQFHIKVVGYHVDLTDYCISGYVCA